MISKEILYRLFIAAGALALVIAAFGDAEAIPSSTAGVEAAVPAFAATGSLTPMITPVAAPAALGPGLPSSVMPPGPPSGAICSVDSTAGGDVCSAFNTNERCSAFNANGNQCSTVPLASPGGPLRCSTFGPNTACTVLPPSMGGNPSGCSTFNGSNFPMECSVIGAGPRRQCSTKGAGLSQCSAFTAPSQCSVINPGSTQRSFCSTKFNQPTISKTCSTFGAATECSVVLGGTGVCTTFGAAAAPSCSAIAAGHCSVMAGGPAGNPCAQ